MSPPPNPKTAGGAPPVGPFGGFGGGARQLLRAVRDIMAGDAKPAERLDTLVRIIADSFVAEVCSIYVMRDGASLVLLATIGLRPEAVGLARLRVGEGLVGTIAERAEPLSLPDAQSHPRFAYLPETGEDAYKSLMGVPILQGGRVVGVLVVQNVSARNYDEEDVEALETIAMVLGELIARGELGLDEQPDVAAPMRLAGTALNRGLALGQAVIHRPDVVIKKVVADNPAAELDRMRTAMAALHEAIDQMLTELDRSGGAVGRDPRRAEPREILETYRMFAHDRGWMTRLTDAVRSGLTAEAAVAKVRDDTRARMEAVTDPYLRERLIDLDDLNNRLLQHVVGDVADPLIRASSLPADMVLIARTLGPAELLEYEPERLRAVVLEEGSHTAHVAIVAKALQIPILGSVHRVLRHVRPNDTVIVDGDHAQILLRPVEQAREEFRRSMAFRERQQLVFRELRTKPAITADGQRISLQMNAGLLIDFAQLEDSGAEGVGLYRTEIPFMVRANFPSVEAQTELYGRVLDRCDGKPVTFRTLDVGGDKRIPYLPGHPEENPAMGWRAIRVGLDLPAMLRQQLRALIRAAAGRPLRVMFPMISEVAELKAARRILELELRRASEAALKLPSAVEVGAMLEVPSLAWQLDTLLPELDFLSIGSNDLLQFVFASDRGSTHLAERYDPLSPAFLTLLREIARKCAEHQVPFTLCGEMAGRPVEAMALVGLGYRALSMSPGAIGHVKQAILKIKTGVLAEYLETALLQPDHSLRGKLRAFAYDHGVPI